MLLHLAQCTGMVKWLDSWFSILDQAARRNYNCLLLWLVSALACTKWSLMSMNSWISEEEFKRLREIGLMEWIFQWDHSLPPYSPIHHYLQRDPGDTSFTKVMKTTLMTVSASMKNSHSSPALSAVSLCTVSVTHGPKILSWKFQK